MLKMTSEKVQYSIASCVHVSRYTHQCGRHRPRGGLLPAPRTLRLEGEEALWVEGQNGESVDQRASFLASRNPGSLSCPPSKSSQPGELSQ